jgi:hypothetical protein
MAKAPLRLVTPTIVNRTVTPKRPLNKDLRTREHLTEVEVERLINATQDNRYGHRDGAMILVAYRHGLNRSRSRLSCSLPSAVLHLRRPVLPEWLSAPAPPLSYRSRPTRTCSGTPAVTRLLTGATIRGRCKRILATRTSSIQSASCACLVPLKAHSLQKFLNRVCDSSVY